MLKEKKQEVIDEFRESKTLRILVSTEARMLRTIELHPGYRPESGAIGQLLRWLSVKQF